MQENAVSFIKVLKYLPNLGVVSNPPDRSDTTATFSNSPPFNSKSPDNQLPQERLCYHR